MEVVDQPLAQQIAHSMLRQDRLNGITDLEPRATELRMPPLLTEAARSRSDEGFISSVLEDSPPRPEDRSNHAGRLEQPLLSVEETTVLFKAKIEDAQRDTEHALAGSEEVSDVVKPKLTLDLGHSRISRLPEAVVDLIKTEVERLSLSHNQIWHIPLRFAECSHLRYLNIRSNVFREIPRGVYKLPELEILDISRNKVRKISKDIRNLTSLRVFSIVHNRIDDLPTDMCEMTKLQILKVAENPLRVWLKKIVEAKEAELAVADMTDNARELAMTTEIKRHLREQHPVMTPVESDPVTAAEDNQTDHPRPMKRVMSSRFPVVPSGQSMDGIPESVRSSPSQTSRAPPIPMRSHYRGVSGQLSAQRRSSITPSVNGNERNRSNSESTVQQNGNARQRRMGILRKEKSDLDAIDETKATRQSHLRGFSHGSALRRSSVISSPAIGNSTPTSPRETRAPTTPSLKRLSCLPEHKMSNPHSPVIEGAKGLLYALHQIELQIRGLLGVVRNDNTKRSSLEPTFYNASKWTKRLNKAVENADAVDPEDIEGSERAQDAVQQLCTDCVMTYKHVISQLQDHVHNVVASTDARYVRTLILQLFGSIIEVKNAMKSFGVEFVNHTRQMSSGNTNPIQTIPEEFTPPQEPKFQAFTPVRERGNPQKQGGRLRSDTAIQHPSTENLPALQPVQPVQPPASARLPPSMQLAGSALNGNAFGNTSVAYTNGGSFGVRSRSNSRNAFSSTNSSLSSVTNTPRSGEGFNLPPLSSLSTRINPGTGMTDAQEEASFEQIYMALTNSYDAALQAVPYVRKQFQRCLEAAEENRQPKEARELWITLIHRCKACQDMSEALQIRLTNMRIKDSGYGTINPGGGRNDPSFWLLCKTFLQSFVDLITDMREAKDLRLLPPEIMTVLRPVHKASRDAGRLIESGPWRNLTDGVGSLPAPTPFTPVGAVPAMQSHQMNGITNGTNGSLSAYSSAISHQQIQQSLNIHQPVSAPVSAGPTPLSGIPAPTLQIPYLQPPSTMNGNGAAINGISPTVQMPATPLSAALGPAAQATIPSTPASAIGDQFFRGDVFQRADSLLNMQSAGGSVNFLNRR